LLSQIQVVPNVSDEHAARCNTELGHALFAASGFPVLDASRSECEWQSDPDALESGIFAPGALDALRLPYTVGARAASSASSSGASLTARSIGEQFRT
jgi:acyl-homoserine-lactone acylase